MKVKVYYNLHKHCWSVVDYKTKRVIDHLSELILTDCTFKVSEAGRQRVLREKRKNVHAFVIGELSTDTTVVKVNSSDIIYYNPYKQATFTYQGEPIHEAKCVLFCKNKTLLNI